MKKIANLKNKSGDFTKKESTRIIKIISTIILIIFIPLLAKECSKVQNDLSNNLSLFVSKAKVTVMSLLDEANLLNNELFCSLVKLENNICNSFSKPFEALEGDYNLQPEATNNQYVLK